MSVPLPVGTRVIHVSQQWATSWTTPNGTAEIVEVRGPLGDDSFEYLVLACQDFSRRPGPGNPMTRKTWWNSNTVRAAGGGS